MVNSVAHHHDDDHVVDDAVVASEIADYIRDRPILDLCKNGERLRGTSSRLWWWEQPPGAELEREEDASSVVSEEATEVGSPESEEDSE